MTVRNFSEDGAAGAMTGVPGTQPGNTATTSLQPQIMNDFSSGWGGGGMESSGGGGAIDDSMFSGTESGWGGGGLTSVGSSTSRVAGGGGLSAPSGSRASTQYSGDWRDQVNQQPNLNAGIPMVQNTSQPGMVQNTGGFNRVAVGFAEGGAIDEDPNATDPQGSGMGASLQASINEAMKAVNDTLSYGRKLHGIGGGGDKQAGVLPSKPFSESEKPRPMPGPLPPTSNPFGKRTSEAEAPMQTAQNTGGPSTATDSDGDNDAGQEQAIETEEEVA